MTSRHAAKKKTRKVVRHGAAALLGCLAISGASALEVGLAGLTASKAMLTINGGEPQVVAVGQTVGGVKLISVQSDQAIVEFDGKKRPLRIGQNAVGNQSTGGGDTLVLKADGQGHFQTMGAINGASVSFLVDTGATMVSLGASDAKRLGLDAGKGQLGITNTANGQAKVSKISLDTLRVGEITLHNVDALILQNDLPFALLGMSFLNRMDMQRDGSTMTLKKRF